MPLLRRGKKSDRDKSLLNNKRIKNNLELLDRSLTDLYRDTYYNMKTDMDDASSIRSDIERSVETIMNNSLSNNTVGNIAKIYSKMANDDNRDIINSIMDMADDSVNQSVLAAWSNNKWVKEQEDEIDMVLKYAPKLKQALLCKKDCVLSADHFNKEFLNFVNIYSKEKEQLFNKRMEELKDVYNLAEKVEKWYDDAKTYGNEYVYIVPYSTEFEKLLRRQQATSYSTTRSFTTEAGNIVKVNGYITESVIELPRTGATSDVALDEKTIEYAREHGLDKISITVNNCGILESSLDGIKAAMAIQESNQFGSVGSIFSEQYINEANSDVGKKDRFADKIIPDELKFPKELEDDRTSSEMIIDRNNKDNNVKITVPGCVVKELSRSSLLPMYIENICLGYYYIETAGSINSNDPNSFEYAAGFSTVANSSKLNRSVDEYNTDEKNKIINYIAGQIYNMIDSKFINDNQELRKELYMILKHNELFNSQSAIQNGNIKVSFLSADDVVDIKFSVNEHTHRGRSALEYSIFPAKLYACLYITNVLGIITRGQDKRVYYVKQTVDTNIHKTMLNVINQIKKGNFGARQMENLGNILNITGRFNDILIPTNSSGDSPINIDVLEGQKFTDNSELTSMLEKQMIDPIVPYDLIEARQSLDYAIQATMSNSILMRSTYKEQDIYEEYLSTAITKIYNYEYEEKENIKVTLPAPSFLNVTNGSNLLEGTRNFLQAIVDTELATEPDDVKAEFIRLGLRYYMPSQLNLPLIDRFKIEARINATKNRVAQEEE